MNTTTRRDIDFFLSRKRLAMVGVSRNPKDFSRILFSEMVRRGYDMVPVNPLMTEVDGARCFIRLQDIKPPVEGALVMTPPSATEHVVKDADLAGIPRVWLHSGAGKGAVSDAAVEYCHQRCIRVVAGYCPFMFLPDTQFVHRFHGFCLKMLGKYPPLPELRIPTYPRPW